ncbi:hypothetical protein BXP70_27870 [Hymenobacter crusticola]|uniref:Uncharacterized protein n=2 Tax=Hymenobacter crusticola TaxID=1770526 RepID=A0A243W6Y2_9BACT|nr:hypothetical protein BXP70_27870 [Hymenobacter crusticola]
MGLDYSYVLLIKRTAEPSLRTHLMEVGSLTQLAAPFGTCVTLDFPLDEALVDYLKERIRDHHGDAWPWRLLFQKRSGYPAYFPTPTTGRIGCIYLDIKPVPSSDYAFVSFDAATSRMSQLFQRSASIKNWFVHLSRFVNAKAAFLDTEEQGYEFFYRDGARITATLTEEGELVQAAARDQQAIRAIYHDYAKLFLL